ncbi:hypothetical protein K8I85_15575, partial [bacterium]|nr:hypothetical protein [bacterium]
RGPAPGCAAGQRGPAAAPRKGKAMKRRLATLAALTLLLAPGGARAGGWTEILLLRNGLYNNAARLAYDPSTGYVELAYKSQLDTDSNTRQIGAGTYDFQGWSIGDVTSNASSKEYPDIVVSGNGVVHAAWREHLGGGDWQIFHAMRTGGQWSVPQPITFDATVKGSPRIALQPALVGADTTGILHVAYSTLEPGTTNDEIHYLRYDTIAQSGQSVPVTSDAVTDDDAQIAVDEGGTVYLAWVSGPFEGAIRCAVGGINGFTDLPTGVASGASKPDLALGANGAQIAYRAVVASGIKAIRHIAEGRATFGNPLDVSPSDALYTEPSLVVAGTLPSVAFVTNTSGRKGLYVAQWNGSGFDTPEVVHSDAGVTYNETDFLAQPFTVGLPKRDASAAFVITSAGYVDGNVVADLHAFEGFITATDAPVVEVAQPLSLRTFPNPFAGAATVAFSLPAPATRVALDVFDVGGRRLARRELGPRGAGMHSLRLPGRDLPAGVYWVNLTADGIAQARRVQRVR